MSRPILTALVSTYNSERFLPGCLDDLIEQTIFQDMEIIVIDSGSLQGERMICETYCRQHRNIQYTRTARESLYSAWNRAIGQATGKYITSANTDDRHARDGLQRLVSALENDPAALLASANQYVSSVENQSFADCRESEPPKLNYPEFSHKNLLFNCTVGSQPVWRAEVHRDIGLFDPSYKISGDHEFWLRTAQRGHFVRIHDYLGSFLVSPQSLSGAENSFDREMETMRAQLTYLTRPPWSTIRNIRNDLATELMCVGYRFLVKHEPTLAAPFLRTALKIAPWRIDLLKTYIIRCAFGSRIGFPNER